MEKVFILVIPMPHAVAHAVKASLYNVIASINIDELLFQAGREIGAICFCKEIFLRTDQLVSCLCRSPFLFQMQKVDFDDSNTV
jgi:hypothetical protein